MHLQSMVKRLKGWLMGDRVYIRKRLRKQFEQLKIRVYHQSQEKHETKNN